MEKDMDQTKLNRKIELVFGLLLLLSAGLLGVEGAKAVSAQNGYRIQSKTVVIDVGHGGIDSGKVSEDGILEKDVNLVIAKKLAQLLEQEDIEVTLTREDDRGLYRDSDQNKKTTDLRNRCKMIEDINPICTVSIHQNSYPSPEVRGAQVFYYRHSTQAQKLAQLIQESIRERVDPDNTRQEKPNDSYYMLKRSTSPTVIVECGFLSCPKEAQLLTEEDYQNKLAWAIHMAVLNYVNQTES